MEDLTKSLEEFVKQRKGDGLIVVEVIEVDLQEMEMDAVDGDDNEYLGIRLNATPKQTGVLAIPKIGSTAIVVDLRHSGQEYVMIHAGEVEKVIFHVAQKSEIEVSMEEIRLGMQNVEAAVQGEKLNTNLSKLIDELDRLAKLLTSFATTQAGVTASPPLTPLAAGYTRLGANLPRINASLSSIKTQLEQHLSSTVKVGS